MNKRFLIIAAGLVGLLTLIIVIGSLRTVFGTGTLTLTIQPADATVTVDGKVADATRGIKLETGKHTATIKRDGFTPRTLTVTIEGNKTVSRTVTLLAANDTGQAYIEEHPEVTAQTEGEAGKEIEANGNRITQNNPLIAFLPYQGSTFRLDIGLSEAHPEDSDAVAIYITAPTADDKTKALGWIKAHGYDPAAYEIIYQ